MLKSGKEMVGLNRVSIRAFGVVFVIVYLLLRQSDQIKKIFVTLENGPKNNLYNNK